MNPLRAFAVASRHVTFTAAAKEMRVGQVAISRQIVILEKYLGVQLFERSARSVKLTEAGRAFAAEISAPFDDLEQAAEHILTHEREIAVKLRIYPTLACYWLLPRLARFGASYPDYQVRVDTTVVPLDFRGTHLDVAVQLGNGAWRDTAARKLFDEVIDVVCSPEYARRFDFFRDRSTLQRAVILQAKYRRREWDQWRASAGFDADVATSMNFDSSILAYRAAQSGLGLAIGQLDILKDELERGTLVRPFDAAVNTGMSFYLVWPTTRSVATQTRRFIDWILEDSGAKREFFPVAHADSR